MEDCGVDKMRYYKDGSGVISTIGTLNLPEITKAEFDAAMAEAARKIEEAEKNTPPSKTDREMIEELSSKQEDLTLRQEDLELIVADAIGGAI